MKDVRTKSRKIGSLTLLCKRSTLAPPSMSVRTSGD